MSGINRIDCPNQIGTGVRQTSEYAIDAVSGNPFACALRHPKRPLLGIYMRYRTSIPELTHQVNLALRYHAQRGNEKWVSLLLWAGGDPHLPVPTIDDDSNEEDSSALEEAFCMGHQKIVEMIGIDPSRDDLNRLLEQACILGHSDLIEKVLDMGADLNGSDPSYPPMRTLINHLSFQMEPAFGVVLTTKIETALDTIAKFAQRGAQWEPEDAYCISRFLRALMNLESQMIAMVLSELSKHKVCSGQTLLRLLKNVRLKEKLGIEFKRLREMVGDI